MTDEEKLSAIAKQAAKDTDAFNKKNKTKIKVGRNHEAIDRKTGKAIKGKSMYEPTVTDYRKQLR